MDRKVSRSMKDSRSMINRLLILCLLLTGLVFLALTNRGQAKPSPCLPNTECYNGCPMGMECDYRTCTCVPIQCCD